MERDFKERTKIAWKDFGKSEDVIREALKDGITEEQKEKITNFAKFTFGEAISNISLEIDGSGKKPKIIFSPDGDKIRLFLLDYLLEHAPKEIADLWDFVVGRPPDEDIVMPVGDISLSASDVQVKMIPEDGKVSLDLYSEKLMAYEKENPLLIIMALIMLSKQVLGELNVMAHIEYLNAVKDPLSKSGLTLRDVPKKMEEMGMDPITDYKDLLCTYVPYEREPSKDPHWRNPFRMRRDIIAGSSSCRGLIEGFYGGPDSDMKILDENGVHAGFIFYDIQLLRRNNKWDTLAEVNHNFKDFLAAVCEEDISTTGGALGHVFSYVDVIAWDLEKVLQAAKYFLDEIEADYGGYHSFWTDEKDKSFNLLCGEE